MNPAVEVPEREDEGKHIACSGGAGLYLTGRFSQANIAMLVDTGASISLMSQICFQKYFQKNELNPVNIVVVTADDGKMKVYGKFSCSFEVGFVSVVHTFYVVEMDTNVLLGLDFLKTNSCLIDVGNKVLHFGDQQVPLSPVSNLEEQRVCLGQNEILPAGGEIFCGAEVEGVPDLDTGIVESTDKLEKYMVKLATSLNTVREGRLGVRLFNAGSEDILLYKGTVLGTWNAINSIGPSLGSDEGDSKQKNGETDTVNSEATSSKGCAESARSSIPTKVQCNHVNITETGKPDVPEHVKDLFERSMVELTESDTKKLASLLNEYGDVFMVPGEAVTGTDWAHHHINTGDHPPIRMPLRRAPYHQKPVIEEELDKMLKDGIIEPAGGPWASPIVLVKKKDGSIRFCVDYRKLNDLTRKDAYPIPRIDETLDTLSGARFFSTLDLVSGYWQVPVAEEDKDKTAFITHRGLFRFNRMPFGLCNSPSTFERLMERVLQGLQWQVCLLYLDDIIIFSNSIEEHFSRLQSVFDRIRSANLKMKAKKCHLFQTEVSYLGHVVSQYGVATAEDKIEKVKDWPTPRCAKEVRQFLGLTSYYRRFIEGYAHIAKPLHKLTEKGKQYKWTTETEVAFDKLKEALSTAPVLAYPQMELPFILDTDASDVGVGGVLSQVQDGIERAISYASFTLSKPEKNYCVTRKELLAIVRMVKHFKPYLYGRRFLLRTDHGSLRWLLNFKEPEGQLARWMESLSEFDFEIQHRPGRSHGNADALSRMECTQCKKGKHPELERCNVITANNTEESNTVELDIGEEQRKDRDICKIAQAIERGDPRPVWKEISTYSAVYKALWGKWDTLSVQENLLVIKWVSEDGKTTAHRIVVPHSMQRSILHELHNQPTGGHLGFAKVWGKLQKRFYWLHMKDHLKEWLACCLQCAKRKGPHRKTKAPLQQYQVGEPLERVAMDILGPLPQTESGNRFILVVTDYFSKFSEAYAMENMEAMTVATLFVNEFICRFGVPLEVHTDQGRQFESALFQGMCQLLRITKTRTSPWHPQADGQCERFNRTLEEMLSMYVDSRQRDWDKFIPFAVMAYRSSPHASTGISPNKLMFGREVRLPVDLALGLKTTEVRNPAQYVIELQDTLLECSQKARDTLQVAAKHQKDTYDRNQRNCTFVNGEQVMLSVNLRVSGLSPKLQARWEGPYTIEMQVGDVNYKIKSVRGKSQIVHVNRLKKFNALSPEEEQLGPRQAKPPQRYGEWV